ncbi:MAG: STAS domain-containing protein [Mycolicibacterium sp.]|uniref:STAS domain-containing protein n=1 Tax=Mycolicibacterium sp. TaxID=2320850 RepID=UPI003D125B40
MQESTAVVAVDGEIDAVNSDELVEFALRDDAHPDRLIVDLSRVSFFATAGFTALHALNVQCANDGVRWMVVTSPAVDRVLRICDPDSALPVCANVAAALNAVHGEPSRLLQLVAKAGP